VHIILSPLQKESVSLKGRLPGTAFAQSVYAFAARVVDSAPPRVTFTYGASRDAYRPALTVNLTESRNLGGCPAEYAAVNIIAIQYGGNHKATKCKLTAWNCTSNSTERCPQLIVHKDFR